MALAWTLDKIGPICRSVDDCALVMQAIYGPDGVDMTVRPAPFVRDAGIDWKRLKIGYTKSLFEDQSPSENPPDNLTTDELKDWESKRDDRAAARARGGRFSALGWPTGFEPATTGTTIRGSTIELRPPFGCG